MRRSCLQHHADARRLRAAAADDHDRADRGGDEAHPRRLRRRDAANHAPLVVAERFKTLEALFPGRIDLGLGRAPGTDQLTAFALRRLQEPRGGDDFLERLQELIFWDRGFPEGHPFRAIAAMPSDAPLPPIWLLGSSD